jgi:hypothetical protein
MAVAATETATVMETVMMAATTTTLTPMPTTEHQGQQQGQHVREVPPGETLLCHLGLPPPTAATTVAMFVGDADAPLKKSKCEESANSQSRRGCLCCYHCCCQ